MEESKSCLIGAIGFLRGLLGRVTSGLGRVTSGLGRVTSGLGRVTSIQLHKLEQNLMSATRIISIISCRPHGSPWFSPATLSYRPSLPASLQGYILYRHTPVVYRSSCLCSTMWRGPQGYVTYELVPSSPAVSCISGWSKLDSFHDGWKVAVQLLLCWMLPSGLVQYSSQHSCVVAVNLFLCKFC